MKNLFEIFSKDGSKIHGGITEKPTHEPFNPIQPTETPTTTPTETPTETPTTTPTESPTEAPIKYTVTVIKNVDEGGTVSGGGQYQSGTSCTVSVSNINSLYIFTGWSNGVTTNTYTFTVTKNITLCAMFELKEIEIPTETPTEAPTEDPNGAPIYTAEQLSQPLTIKGTDGSTKLYFYTEAIKYNSNNTYATLNKNISISYDGVTWNKVTELSVIYKAGTGSNVGWIYACEIDITNKTIYIKSTDKIGCCSAAKLKYSVTTWADGRQLTDIVGVRIGIYGSAKISGNIMSLLNYSNTVGERGLEKIFVGAGRPFGDYAQYLPTVGQTYPKDLKIDAKELLLPATTVKDYGYFMMFQFALLDKAPKYLPATTIEYDSYNAMFRYATINAPVTRIIKEDFENGQWGQMWQMARVYYNGETKSITDVNYKDKMYNNDEIFYPLP